MRENNFKELGERFEVSEPDENLETEKIYAGTIDDFDADDKSLIWLLKEEIGFVIVWVTVTLCLIFAFITIYCALIGDWTPFKYFIDFIVKMITALKS